MALEGHLAELDEKHKYLDDLIAEEFQHFSVDTLKLNELKREKLRLKEEMERIRSGSHH